MSIGLTQGNFEQRITDIGKQTGIDRIKKETTTEYAGRIISKISNDLKGFTDSLNDFQAKLDRTSNSIQIEAFTNKITELEGNVAECKERLNEIAKHSQAFMAADANTKTISPENRLLLSPFTPKTATNEKTRTEILSKRETIGTDAERAALKPLQDNLSRAIRMQLKDKGTPNEEVADKAVSDAAHALNAAKLTISDKQNKAYNETSKLHANTDSQKANMTIGQRQLKVNVLTQQKANLTSMLKELGGPLGIFSFFRSSEIKDVKAQLEKVTTQLDQLTPKQSEASAKAASVAVQNLPSVPVFNPIPEATDAQCRGFDQEILKEIKNLKTTLGTLTTRIIADQLTVKAEDMRKTAEKNNDTTGLQRACYYFNLADDLGTDKLGKDQAGQPITGHNHARRNLGELADKYGELHLKEASSKFISQIKKDYPENNQAASIAQKYRK